MRLPIFYSLLVTVGLSSFAMAPNAFGQNAPSQSTPSTAQVPKTLTLDEAVKLAVLRNYNTRIDSNNVRRGAIEVTRSKDNMWLPTAGASAGWNYDYSLQAQRTRAIFADTVIGGIPIQVPTGTESVPSGSHTLTWKASVGYNLFNGGSDLARVNVAEASLGAAQNSYIWNRQVTAFTVTTDYLDVLRNAELVDAAQKTLQEAVAQLNLVRGKYEAGVVPIGQVYQQEAVVGQDSVSLIQARNSYENAQATLLFVLNVPPDQFPNYTFSLVGIDTSTGPASRIAVDTTIQPGKIDQAIDHRPDILAQLATIDADKFRIDETRGALYPSLNASAGIGGSGANSDLSRVQVANGLTAGLSLSVPIFDAMQTRLLMQEEEVDVENAEILLQQYVQQIRNDVTVAINNLKGAEQALDAANIGLRSAEESLRLAEERLSVGAGTQVDVVVAENQVVGARVSWVNAKYSWVLAQRQLQYTLGQWNY